MHAEAHRWLTLNKIQPTCGHERPHQLACVARPVDRIGKLLLAEAADVAVVVELRRDVTDTLQDPDDLVVVDLQQLPQLAELGMSDRDTLHVRTLATQ